MELSIAGLIGAFVGIVIALINYGVIISFVERRLRALDKSQTHEEREEFERRLSIMRRSVLGVDVVVFGGIGYWFGRTMGG